MSCFGGLMREYRYLSIDRFDGANLLSGAYFLSHCHMDHMVGLDTKEFRNRLTSSSDIYLYCSEVTGALLLADDRYSPLAQHVHTLPIDDPTILEIRQSDGEILMVSVTLVPAGHCPGSVMFLFEGHEGTVLYTGDFRLRKGSAKRMKFLHTSYGPKKPIKSIYVDTTFCRPDAVYIPSRENCLQKLQSVVSEWFAKGEMHAVRLNISAKYGYEYIFDALGRRFGTKIYCRRKEFYRCLPHIYDILTTDPQDAKIYACFKKERIGKKSHWNVSEDDVNVPVQREILRITLSTMYFIYEAMPNEICHRIGKNHYRLCFSFHSSHGEVCDLVRYFQPENVYANVKPRDSESLEEVEKRLAKDCGLKVHDEPNISSKHKVKATLPATSNSKTTQKAPRKRAICLGTDDDDSQDLFEKLINKNKSKRKVGAEGYVVREGDSCSDSTVLTKREICPGEDNDDSQDLHERLVNKNKRRGGNETNDTAAVIPEESSTSNALKDDYNISSSPEDITQSEIDELHVKIALSGGKLTDL